MGWKLLVGVLLIGTTSFGGDFKTIVKGAFSGIESPLQVVVTNKTQWAELWQKHTARMQPKPAAPEIDFDKQSVILVALGRKTRGGYSIEISDVHRSKDKTEITVTTKEPKPGDLTVDALTSPFHIVAVPKIEGDAQFKTVKKNS